jgi:hypothetical protein
MMTSITPLHHGDKTRSVEYATYDLGRQTCARSAHSPTIFTRIAFAMADDQYFGFESW